MVLVERTLRLNLFLSHSKYTSYVVCIPTSMFLKFLITLFYVKKFLSTVLTGLMQI